MSFHAIFRYASMSKKQLGAAGERIACEALNHAGYDAKVTNFANYGDITVCDDGAAGGEIDIEVKTATRNSRGQWCFTLCKNDKYGGTNCRNCDFVILLCIGKSGVVLPFVIPIHAIRGKRAITIPCSPYRYTGKYATYLQSINKLQLQLGDV